MMETPRWQGQTTLPIVEKLAAIERALQPVLAEYLRREAAKVEHLAEVAAVAATDCSPQSAVCSQERSA